MHASRIALPLLLLGGVLSNALLYLHPAPHFSSTGVSISQQISDEMAGIAAQVSPAVVSILNRRPQRGALTGSGVLLSRDGRIVTNNHVIAGAERVQVTLRDGRRLSARILGVDPETDLAVLDIEGDDFPFAELSHEAPPPVGTWVLAIGNPLGLDHTVTSGIISARGRAGIDVAIYEDFLQTDAAINSGNSGGPLVNLQGDIVGLNTAIEMVRGNQGLGFAIPAYMIQKVVDDILEMGYVERGYFGISVQDMAPAYSERLGLSPAARVLVKRVEKGTPAEAAGLEQYDLLLEIGGQTIRTERQLFDDIANLAPGSKVAVDVWRSGERKVLMVTVGERQPQNEN